MMKRRLSALCGAGLLAAGCGGEQPVSLPVPMSENLSIAYPVDLWDAGIEGETTLTLHVNVEGRVDSVRVERTSGSPRLDSAAVAGGRVMRFTPGRKGDKRVGAWVSVPVRFRRDSAGTAADMASRSDRGADHE